MNLGAKLLRRLFKRRSYALNELDRKLSRYLDFDGGFFIEAGANDGIQQSNTLFFERHRKWTGLLVEPIPELANRCRRNRTRCLVENVALTSFEDNRHTIEMRYCNLMSLVKGAMKTPQEELAHIEAGCRGQKIESRDVTVPAGRLSEILDRHRIERIDLFSLDVEGFELNVLKGLDFDKHRPVHMLIEARYRQEIDSFLQPLYEPIAELSHHDVLYRLKAA